MIFTNTFYHFPKTKIKQEPDEVKDDSVDKHPKEKEEEQDERQPVEQDKRQPVEQDERQPVEQDERQSVEQDETQSVAQDEKGGDKGEQFQCDEIEKHRGTFEKVFGDFSPISSASKTDLKSPDKEQEIVKLGESETGEKILKNVSDLNPKKGKNVVDTVSATSENAELSPTSLVNAAIMTPPPIKRRRKTVVNVNVGKDSYDSDLTSRLRKFKVLDADIKKMKTYLVKAKNRRTFVHRSLEELGISSTMLDDEDNSGNLAVVSFSNVQERESVEEPALDIIEIEPKEEMLSPIRVVSVQGDEAKNVSIELKQTKNDKPSKHFPKDVQDSTNFPKDVEDNDVIVLGSSSDEGDDIGFDFDSGFDI